MMDKYVIKWRAEKLANCHFLYRLIIAGIWFGAAILALPMGLAHSFDHVRIKLLPNMQYRPLVRVVFATFLKNKKIFACISY